MFSRPQFRINVKDNIIKVNQIFAHAFGFRANIDLLQPERKTHKIRRREIYETLETLINQYVHVSVIKFPIKIHLSCRQ